MTNRFFSFREGLLFLITTFSFVSFGEIYKPALLTQTNYSGGFIGPNASYSEKCAVFQDKVIIEHGLGSSKITETRQIQNGASLKSLIQSAALEQMIYEDNYLCDGPSSSVYTNLKDSSGQVVYLYQTGGCGSVKSKRVGTASELLLRFMEKFCSKPY